jgi:plasmid stability protein
MMIAGDRRLHNATTRDILREGFEIKEAAVATLHVRNIPDDLYDRIRVRAEASSRSLSAEVVVLLNRAFEDKEPSVGQLLTEIRRRRTFRPSAVGLPDSTTLLREDRDR